MPSYVQKIHRDCKFFYGQYRLMLNCIVFIDDLTSENGATQILPRSHRTPTQPSEEYFSDNCVEILGSEGTIVLLDSLIWHRAGVNVTDKPRLVLSIVFSKPFIKQRLDYPKYLCTSYENIATEKMLQLLGFKSRVPTSLEEWYLPKKRRFFQEEQ